MRNQIDTEQIKIAINAIRDSGMAVNNAVPDTFTGYIASFGASVVQAGLLPTVIFFSQQAGAAQDRTKVIDALRRMAYPTITTSLSSYLLNNLSDDERIEAEAVILEAALALKLALRTFPTSPTAHGN